MCRLRQCSTRPQSSLPEFVVIGRADPDGKALRFALAQNVRVNTMEAGEQLFIDLLPQGWQGVAPGLPPEVVAELARRAADVERAAEIEARRKALETSKYKLRIHVGQQPTFSRIVFDWGAKVGVQLSRKGNVITVAFDQLAKPPMGRLKSDPPRYVKSSRAYFDDEGLKIDLTIDKDSDVRGFREENTYVVDISAPPGAVNDDNEPVANATKNATEQPEGPAELVELNRDTVSQTPPATDEPQIGSTEPETSEQPAAPPEGETEQGIAPEPAPLPDDAIEVAEPQAEDKAVPDVVVGEFYLNPDGDALASAEDTPESNVAASPETQPQTPADTTPVTKNPSFGERPAVEVAGNDETRPTEAGDMTMPDDDVSANPNDAENPVVVATAERDGTVLHVRFPFGKATAAAVFRRADILWLVFENGSELQSGCPQGPERRPLHQDRHDAVGRDADRPFHAEKQYLVFRERGGKTHGWCRWRIWW